MNHRQRPASTPRRLRTSSVLPTRSRCSGPLLDLALSFYGDTAQSLDAFLSAGFASSALEPITEADLRRKLRQEQQAAAALMGVWQSEETQRIGDLLRPFALLFDRRELPAFDFQLNESFQVAQVNGHTLEPALLEAGDRILAINNHRLVLPDDLLKCRSRLVPGQEVHLDVERRSLSSAGNSAGREGGSFKAGDQQACRRRQATKAGGIPERGIGTKLSWLLAVCLSAEWRCDLGARESSANLQN